MSPDLKTITFILGKKAKHKAFFSHSQKYPSTANEKEKQEKQSDCFTTAIK